MKIFTSLIVLLFLILSCTDQDQLHEEKIYHLHNKLDKLSSNEVELAYAYIDTGLSLSKSLNNQKFTAYFLVKKGNLFCRSNPNLAVSCYYEAKEIYKTIGDKKGLAICLVNIGSVANIDPSESLTYLAKALQLSYEIKDTLKIIHTYNNIGKFLFYIDSPDSAKSCFQKSKLLSEKKRYPTGIALSNLNIGVILYMAQKNYSEALRLLYLAETQMPKNRINYLSIKANIMNAYFEMDEPDSALHYYELLQKKDLHLRPDLAANCYTSLSEYYTRIQDLPNALKFDEKADSVKELIRSKNNENQISLLELEYNFRMRKQKVARLNAEIKRSKVIRLALGVLLLFSVVFSYILLRQQKKKAKKKRELLKTEQELTKAKLENSELSQRVLHEELKFTNKELSSFAAGIVKNTDHLNDIKKHISIALDEKSPKKLREEIRELNTKINQLFQKDKEQKEFIKRTRQVNHSLIFFLKSRYPHLSDSDTNLLVLMMLKFTSKEISSLYNIEEASVEKKRYRLRKKMGLKDWENFDDFMDGLIKDFKAVH